MTSHHAILYDVERWRGWRTWLLFPATVCLLVSVFVPTLKGGQVPQLTSLTGAFLFALAASFWTRQRFTYVGVEGGDLVIRVFLMRQRIPLSEVRSVKIARLASRFARPERQRALPRPAHRWLQREAVIVRLETEPQRLVRLTRMLGARCMDGRDLVVPVSDPQRFVAEIEEARPEPAPAVRRGRRRR